MIPDVNVLVHAYNADSPVHHQARSWLEDALSGTSQVGFAWVALLGFIRITTNSRVMDRLLHVAQATAHVRSWIAQPYTRLVEPSSHHAEVLFGLLERIGSADHLTTDAHLASLAIAHEAEIHSTDADFARFPGLKWVNLISRWS